MLLALPITLVMGYTARLVALILAPGLALASNISVPLFFMPNSGLADPQFRYLAQTPSFHAGFGPEMVVFQLPGFQIQLRFPGAARSVKITCASGMLRRVNFLTGRSPDARNTQLPTRGEVVYHELYSGIDLAYLGSRAELKSEFHVALEYPGQRIKTLHEWSCGCRWTFARSISGGAPGFLERTGFAFLPMPPVG